MRSQAILTLLSAAAATAQQVVPSAPVESGSPAGAVYMARLPEEAFSASGLDGNVEGSITAMTRPDGEGVLFSVMFANLPATGGPFGYHIHVAPVPEDGNCTKTLAHLDPFARGETPACDSTKPETCQVGDLSGKWGAIPDGDTSFVATFTDPYVTLEEGPGAFFGNRSFVLHYANKTRITCANFEAVGTPSSSTDDCDASTPDETTETSTPSSSSPLAPPASQSSGTVPKTPIQTAGAAVTGFSALAVFAALFLTL